MYEEFSSKENFIISSTLHKHETLMALRCSYNRHKISFFVLQKVCVIFADMGTFIYISLCKYKFCTCKLFDYVNF